MEVVINMAFYSYIFTANYKRFSKNLKSVSKKYHKSYLGMLFDTVISVKNQIIFQDNALEYSHKNSDFFIANCWGL